MDIYFILDYLAGLSPLISKIFMTLGALVVIGTSIDAAIPDEKDKGFMKKILSLPYLGFFLKSLSRFSPFNFKEK